MSAPHSGGCQCGAARFEATSDPKFISNCHCKACRKATGAAFSTWVGFNNENVRWVTDEPSFYESSEGVRRGYCAKCGTPLTYAGDKWAGETHFLIGVMDKPEEYAPEGDAFPDEALSWTQRIKSAT
ncbi:GFA family protein [Hyphococcus luteus]|uniref:GFA family protein n=1 Tax=Hyphococcus luteus TaxID=2058213 RepID=A0A2S7K0V8_9PROT|nr:GFA family protein [Marinicaulis flavus]PQA86091.1 GFA family protein [Marinicaulis flavus]